MVTNRIPLARSRSGAPLPDAAVDLFAQMLGITCTCKPPLKKYWEHKQCAGCECWSELHSRLAKLVPHRPWQWPVVVDPAEPPDPRRPHDEPGRVRWRELTALLDERDRAAISRR
jgi:hypothetical protein